MLSVYHRIRVTDVEARLLHGHPASILEDFAGEIPNNLVAMTTRGLGVSGIYRWTVGSITQRVVASSRNPVLVVRAMEDDPANG